MSGGSGPFGVCVECGGSAWWVEIDKAATTGAMLVGTKECLGCQKRVPYRINNKPKSCATTADVDGPAVPSGAGCPLCASMNVGYSGIGKKGVESWLTFVCSDCKHRVELRGDLATQMMVLLQDAARRDGERAAAQPDPRRN